MANTPLNHIAAFLECRFTIIPGCGFLGLTREFKPVFFSGISFTRVLCFIWLLLQRRVKQCGWILGTFACCLILVVSVCSHYLSLKRPISRTELPRWLPNFDAHALALGSGRRFALFFTIAGWAHRGRLLPWISSLLFCCNSCSDPSAASSRLQLFYYNDELVIITSSLKQIN